MHRIIEVFAGYFQEVTEDIIKDNFTTVYQVRLLTPSAPSSRLFLFVFQLLDEMMDDGFPFNTDANALQDMIKARGAPR